MNTKLRCLQEQYTAHELRKKIRSDYDLRRNGKMLCLSKEEYYYCPHEIDETLKGTRWCDEFTDCERCWKSFIDKKFSHKERLNNKEDVKRGDNMNTKLRCLQGQYTVEEMQDKLVHGYEDEEGVEYECALVIDKEAFCCPGELDITLSDTDLCAVCHNCEKCWNLFIENNFKTEDESKEGIEHKDLLEFKINDEDAIQSLTKDEIADIYMGIGPVRFSESDLYTHYCPCDFGMNYEECNECGSLSSCDSCWISNLETELKTKKQNSYITDTKEIQNKNMDELKEIVKNMDHEHREIAINIIEHENYMDKVKSVVSNFKLAENMTDLDKQDLYEYIKEIKDIANIMHFTEDDWIQFAADFAYYFYKK